MRITPFTFDSLIAEEVVASSSLLTGEATEALQEDIIEEEVVPTITPQELEQAAQEAHEDGFMMGKKEGLREAEKLQQEKQEEQAALLKAIEQNMQAMQQQYDALLNARQAELAPLILLSANKLAGEALRKDPVSDITEMVKQCCMALFDTPEVTAQIHPEMVALLENKLPKNVTLEADETLKMQDCTINWQHGTAIRDSAAIMQELEDVIERYFTASEGVTENEIQTQGVSNE